MDKYQCVYDDDDEDEENKLLQFSYTQPVIGEHWWVYLMVKRKINPENPSVVITEHTDIHKSQWPPTHEQYANVYGSPSRYPGTHTQKQEVDETNLPSVKTVRKKPRNSTNSKNPLFKHHYNVPLIVGPFETKSDASFFRTIWRENTRASIPRAAWGFVLAHQYNKFKFIDWKTLTDADAFKTQCVIAFNEFLILSPNAQ